MRLSIFRGNSPVFFSLEGHDQIWKVNGLICLGGKMHKEQTADCINPPKVSLLRYFRNRSVIRLSVFEPNGRVFRVPVPEDLHNRWFRISRIDGVLRGSKYSRIVMKCSGRRFAHDIKCVLNWGYRSSTDWDLFTYDNPFWVSPLLMVQNRTVIPFAEQGQGRNCKRSG